ncbi:PaaI family thioesterase [Phenylobacterium sp.]|mgnify:FL=1|uniref:PaaI family thioesterase n=1 Tax=Phenylobacterium sp. TaxID=1871053 RepID=UPI00260CB7DE|nr:PaaI family thioesterase [Phenylobacterium sp.]
MVKPPDFIAAMTGSLTEEAARHMVTRTPQTEALGFQFVSIGEARGAIRVPWRADLVGDPETGVIASGVVTTLLDHVCGLSIRAAAAIPQGTLDLRIDYMRPARPQADLVADGHCYKLTRTIAFVRALAHDGDPDDPVATAQAAFALIGGGA